MSRMIADLLTLASAELPEEVAALKRWGCAVLALGFVNALGWAVILERV